MATNLAELKKKFLATRTRNEPLFGIVLASRGSGKSGLLGTLGVPTLFIFLSEESHGVEAAVAVSKGSHEIVPLCLNQDASGKTTSTPELNPDLVLKNLLEILSTPDLENEFGAVVFDGLSALDRYVYACSEVQKASKYDINKVTLTVYDRIIAKMKALHGRGLHVITTCAAEGTATNDGTAAVLTPKLRGTGVIDSVIGQFGDVLVVGSILLEDPETGEVTRQHALQFGSNIEKVGKRITGQSFAVTFRPRLAGLRSDQVPDLLPADLANLQEEKTRRKGA